MRISSGILSSALLPILAGAINFDCKDIRVDGFKYDLRHLGGVHTLYHADHKDGYVLNTTYVLNICNILGGSSIRGGLKCGTSKNICGFQYNITNESHEEVVAFPIAGFDPLGHGAKDPEIKRLKQIDPDTEGLQIKLAGGEYRDDSGKKKDARAVIEFQCDPDRSGLEGLADAEEKAVSIHIREEEDDENKGDENSGDENNGDENNGDDPSRSLQYKSFGPADDKSYVLSLSWKTRYACDNYRRDQDAQSSNHWGFFTWLIIIFFLCAAAYLIFGSWLNYNRYGARGWDLLPHGDTIRDIPYIFQDWLRRVVNTLQGTGSRGGYSAV